MKNTARLRRQILSREAPLAVVGQGYVGLSVACAAAEAGFTVMGVDSDAERIQDLSAGIMSVPGVSEESFRDAIESGRLHFTTEHGMVRDQGIVLICVPTPVRDSSPDVSFIESACKTVAAQLSPGCLVVLESTTYPGTTEELVRPILESSGLFAERDFLLAYSPERIDPGNDEYSMRNIPRVVGGVTPEAAGLAALFYEQLVDKVFVVSSTRAAELAKLLENTFRHVNIALVNEMATLCHEMGIDVWEVIEATATKPFGFMPFSPGPGVGGHCIPLDPTYLAWQVRRDAGHQFRILEQAEDINAQMPRYVAARIGEALNEMGKPMRESSVLVLGVAYKPDVGDVRESPAVNVMRQLYRTRAKVSFHDPYVDAVSVNGDLLRRTELSLRSISGADCVALLTPHSTYDLEWIAENAQLVFDAQNAFGASVPTNVVRL